MRHIKTENEDNKTWCGQEITANSGIFFKNAELAALAGFHHFDTPACRECVHIIISNLENVRNKNENEN